MRKIILGLAVSLDGLIEGPNGEYDWCFTDQNYGMTAFLRGIDSIFYGRKTYEMMMTYEPPEGETPWKGKKSYVFSNTLKSESKDFELVSGDIEKKVIEIKNTAGKDIWLFGGASLTTSLINAGLVDRLWLSVHPIVLGQGKPLFAGVRKRIKTKLIEVKPYDTGLVSISYEVLN